MRLGTAAILAGGGGSRLGGLAKEGLVVDGEATGHRLVRILGERFGTLIVVTKDPAFYEGLRVITIADLVPGFGPLSGLHAALSSAREEWIWLAACDMPAFDGRLVDLLEGHLDEALEGHLDGALSRGGATGRSGAPPLACIARYAKHFEPFQAIYARRLLPHLEALFRAASEAGEGAPRSVLQPSFKELFAPLPVEFVPEAEVRAISPDWGLFFNINTPEDMQKSLSL